MLLFTFLYIQNSLACPDAGKSLEDTGEVHPHEGEEPAAEGLASVSPLLFFPCTPRFLGA